MDILLLMLLVYVLVAGLPGWIAHARNHPAKSAIGFLCVLTAWTGIAWVIALVWSLSPIPKAMAATESDACAGCNPHWPIQA